MGTGRDDKSKTALQDSKGIFAGPYRACLVDIVSDGLRYKPEHVSVEEYFAEQLEPVLSRLAVDLSDSRPEDPVVFVQEWIDKEEARRARPARGNPSARSAVAPASSLAHIAAWRDRTKRHEMEAELQRLRRRFAVLEEALRSAPFGGSVIAAMITEDVGELTSLFGSCRPAVPGEAGSRRADAEHRSAGANPEDLRVEHKAVSAIPLMEDKATATSLTCGAREASGGCQLSLEEKATSPAPATEHKAAATSALEESCALGLQDKARDTSLGEKRRGNDPSRNPRALEAMGAVLEALHSRGVTSASAAFSYFGPTSRDGSFLETAELVSALKSLGVLQSEQVALLAGSLDPRGVGRVAYRDFRASALSFLSSSQEYHAALSQRELSAILQRVHQRLQAQGRSVPEAFARWTRTGRTSLDPADFVAGLRSLRLGLSAKEAAQVLETLGTWRPPSSLPASGDGTEQVCEAAITPQGRVSLRAFEEITEWCAGQDDVRSWVGTTFEHVRRQVARRCLEAWAREHAEAPARRHLGFGGFSALVSDALPSAAAADVSALWCALAKDDDAGSPLVELDEFLRYLWLQPQEPAPPKPPQSPKGTARSPRTPRTDSEASL